MTFRAIGLMSGTSLDGLDICFADFQKTADQWKFEILHAETIEYTNEWEKKLRDAMHLSSEKLLALHSDYGFYLGEKVHEFIIKNSITYLDLTASHGHTVFHQPQNRFTLQIGDGRAIKILNKIPVVYDFRSQDVLMGGNGAPLVPIGDELLFSEFDACLNLGGFSNISFKHERKRIAFDICPVNIVLNRYAQLLNKSYDENGDFARSGIVDENVLKALNSISFYENDPPKSLGLEWVRENVFELFEGMLPKDILATFIEHAAEQISKVLEKYDLNKILFTGGGTYNSFLIELIRNKCNSEIVIPSRQIIDYKEALIFAFMGVLRMNNETNVLASATGCSEDHSSGLIV